MSLLEAIIMGLIQGITEFLPVSSSGHLALFEIAFDLEKTGLLFDCLLHFGTLIAVFAVYFRDIWKMICEGFGIIGIAAKDLIELASSVLIVPGICLIITSILLFIADRCKEGSKTPKHVSYTNAFIIGICQGFATLPGISRSGTTITACLLSGFDRRFAVKYSFIMSIPAILGSVVLQLFDLDITQITSSEWINYLAGTLTAAAVGYICIKIMLFVVKEKKYTIFSIYCLIVGAISIGAFFILG